MNEKNINQFPEGREYLTFLRGIENSCENTSYTVLGSEEKSLKDIIEQLGTVLSLLYRLASCFWGCHGKGHVVEYLVGRTVTSAHSSLRLINFGYYDESIALTRNISEIGNLFQLFLVEPSHFNSWLELSEKQRRKKYSPSAVRKAVKKAGSPVPTLQSEYSWFSEIGTHVTPRTIPQKHNEAGQPILGGVFQDKGFKSAIDNLSWAVCTVAGPASKIARIKQVNADQIFKESIKLAESVTHYSENKSNT